MTDVPHNRIWLGGVEIDVISGDVSWLHQRVMEAIADGGGWISMPTPTGSYEIYVSPSTDVIVGYVG